MPMAFSLEAFAAFCADDAAIMVAHACDGDAQRELACSHRLAGAPAPADRAVLDALAPGVRETLERFYATHAGAELFVVDGEAGLVLARPSEWEALAGEIEAWYGDARDEMDPAELAMLESALVFGRLPQAATYFLLVRSGELAGQVAMFSGPGLELWPVQPSFEAYLTALPERAVRWMESDTRYCPDAGEEQYYPVAYRPRGVPVARRKMLRVSLASRGKTAMSRYEFDATTDEEQELEAPSGRTYSLVVEFYEGDEAAVSVNDDERDFVYVRGHGNMTIQARLFKGDVLNGVVETPAG